MLADQLQHLDQGHDGIADRPTGLLKPDRSVAVCGNLGTSMSDGTGQAFRIAVDFDEINVVRPQPTEGGIGEPLTNGDCRAAATQLQRFHEPHEPGFGIKHPASRMRELNGLAARLEGALHVMRIFWAWFNNREWCGT